MTLAGPLHWVQSQHSEHSDQAGELPTPFLPHSAPLTNSTCHLQGLFTGFSRGIVGTVTKPVAGVLDFAAGAASAVRDTSRGSLHLLPPRVRRPRCCYGPGGLLPAYSEHHAHAQDFLFSLNKNNYEEM